MISKLILDKLIPLPTEEELMEQIRAELAAEGYPVNNLRSGGVFYMLVRIFVRVKVELLGLIRTMLSNLFVSGADNIDWLELRAADYGKTLKQAVKTEGTITLDRQETGSAVLIKKGCIFKTDPNTDGEELRYISTKDILFPVGESRCFVPVVAELAGSSYNVPEWKITRSLIYLETVTGIFNGEGWITREGSDIETLESLRSRTLNAFNDLASNPTRGKYQSVCEAVPGVLHVTVNDQHPRGQGTLDLVVTSSVGAATDALLADVLAAAKTIAGPYDNILVKSSETVSQNVAVTVILPSTVSADGVVSRAQEAIRELFKITYGRSLNELYLSDIIVAVKGEVPTAKGVRVTEPLADLVLESNKVIILEDVSVVVERA